MRKDKTVHSFPRESKIKKDIFLVTSWSIKWSVVLERLCLILTCQLSSPVQTQIVWNNFIDINLSSWSYIFHALNGKWRVSLSIQCSIDLKLRRCLPYFNLSVLEQSKDNLTVDSDRSFLLSILMQKEDSRGNIGECSDVQSVFSFLMFVTELMLQYCLDVVFPVDLWTSHCLWYKFNILLQVFTLHFISVLWHVILLWVCHIMGW